MNWSRESCLDCYSICYAFSIPLLTLVSGTIKYDEVNMFLTGMKKMFDSSMLISPRFFNWRPVIKTIAFDPEPDKCLTSFVHDPLQE